MTTLTTINHFHLFCGLGGGAKGFNRGHARVGSLQARFRCIGGVDNDAAAIADFTRLAGTPGTVLDMFDRDQYRDWHGHEPPADWRECTPADLQRAAGGHRPHIVFTSPPCKGFSGLLSQKKSTTDKYQALNRLTVRGIWLALEAWADDPPEFFILENVPRIATRGAHLLDQIENLLTRYGYAVARTTHDCGELGGLGQSRKRFLLVARHAAKVPPFLYEPERKPLRSVGDVLERFPMPGDTAAGPMHTLPALQWKTWVRLAFVEAGKDWRSLNDLAVDNGHLRDYLIVPDMRAGVMGVCDWHQAAGTVAGRSGPTNGNYSVADPRPAPGRFAKYGVTRYDATANTVIGGSTTGEGAFAVADPRFSGNHEFGQYGVRRWAETAGAVSGQSAPGGGRYAVADPRMPPSRHRQNGIYRVTPFDCSAHAVTGAAHVAGAALSVADPRPNIATANGYHTAAHYGVTPWHATAGAVTGRARHDNGPWSVADPRPLPKPDERVTAIICALDGTWHRPFTTLELAALQGLVDPDEHLELTGTSNSRWRERIGNAVPPHAAEAIASVMGTTLLLAMTGETFTLSNLPIWVKPIGVALATRQEPAS